MALLSSYSVRAAFQKTALYTWPFFNAEKRLWYFGKIDRSLKKDEVHAC